MICEITVSGLRVRAFHGVLNQERQIGNIFEVDAKVLYPFENAMISDNVCDTLNYAELVDIIKRCMLQPSKLLEHVAGRIQKAIITRYPDIKGGEIAIRKLTPPIRGEMKYVGVKISW